MAVLSLKGTVGKSGINQGDLVDLLTNLITVVNELVTDHATFKTAVDELNTLTTELRTDHATFKAITDEVKDDIDQFAVWGLALLAKLDADIGITDTDYDALLDRTGSTAVLQAAAVASADVATITAAAATAGPATLTNATALTLSKA